MPDESLTRALAPLRTGLQADGYDLYLDEATTPDDVVVCLEATPSACQDCLSPDEVLTQIVDAAIRRADPAVSTVRLVKKGFDALPVE